MKSGMFFLLFMCAFAVGIFAESGSENIKVSFSTGSVSLGVALGVALGGDGPDGWYEGNLGEVYLTDRKSGLGLMCTPLDAAYSVKDGFALSFVNFSVFHQTFRLGSSGFVGPFARINWYDMLKGEPTYSAGIVLHFRDELTCEFGNGKAGFHDPLLFNFARAEIGVRYHERNPEFYLSIGVDAACLVPFVLPFLSAKAASDERLTQESQRYTNAKDHSYTDLPKQP